MTPHFSARHPGWRIACAGVVATLFIAVAPTARATGIVAFHRPDSITLAADSGAVDENGKPTSERLCKIVPGSRVAMAFAREANSTTFDIARRVVQRATSVAEALDLFPKEGESYLRALAAKPGPRVALEVLVAGFDEAQAKVVIVEFQRVPQASELRSNTMMCPPGCTPLGAPWGMGIVDAPLMLASWQSFPRTFREDLVKSAQEILARQKKWREASGEAAVVAPFDVLEITAKGMQWKSHKKECPEI